MHLHKFMLCCSVLFLCFILTSVEAIGSGEDLLLALMYTLMQIVGFLIWVPLALDEYSSSDKSSLSKGVFYSVVFSVTLFVSFVFGSPNPIYDVIIVLTCWYMYSEIRTNESFDSSQTKKGDGK